MPSSCSGLLERRERASWRCRLSVSGMVVEARGDLLVKEVRILVLVGLRMMLRGLPSSVKRLMNHGMSAYSRTMLVSSRREVVAGVWLSLCRRLAMRVLSRFLSSSMICRVRMARTTHARKGLRGHPCVKPSCWRMVVYEPSVVRTQHWLASV